MTKNLHHLVPAGLKRSAAICFAAAASMGFVGCIDDKYDLSDIDTNVRLKVENLTLPINLQEIQLDNIINNPKPGDILQIVDGQYALLRTGDFASKDLKVDPIRINAPSTRPSITTFSPNLPSAAPAKAAPTEVSFFIKDTDASPMEYSYSGVSKDIVEITGLGATWTIKYDVNIQAVGNNTSTFYLKHFVFQLPAGLDGTPSIGKYDPVSGLITVNDYEVVNNRLVFTMAVTGIDAKLAKVKFDPATHDLEIHSSTGVVDGEIILKFADISTSGVPEELRVSTSLTLSPIEVESFSGKIKYDVDDFSIDPVYLNSLPDVLSQPGTSISLANPQIYIRVENPFSQYGVYATTGMKLTAVRNGEAPVVSEINDKTFNISSAPVSFYCLSPEKPDKYYEGYTAATPVKFTQLSTALAGNGLPSKIVIDLDPTVVPAQTVNNFRLGSYNPVKGDYVFYSPLALGANAVINYTSTEDGWNDDGDLDKLTVTHLEVNTDVTNDLPFDIKLTATPISKPALPAGEKEPVISEVIVKGGTTQHVTITVDGTVRNLDGITYCATATSDNNSTSLKPDQNIDLKNIKITVSGYYDDEL